MPTARDLLEQADALMRRNRKRGKGQFGDVPTLTDALGIDRDALLAPTMILPDAQAPADPIALGELTGPESAATDAPVDADPILLDTLADVPVLTDVVLAWSPAAELPGPIAIVDEALQLDDAFPASAAEAEAVAAQLPPPAVLEQEASEPPAAPYLDIVETVQPASAAPSLADDFILDIPPSQEAPAAVANADDSPIPPVAGPATPVPGSRDWDALAEEIRMQVLQRLDLFTDTGLREQLGERLKPIVERASTALVETINRELGELVRGYVAEAIEREIDSWRNRDSS